MIRFGDVDVQEMSWTPGREVMRQAVRVVMGIALLMLVSGIWVCLWVPPF
jgi:hypothetical protein